ncbi:MAG: hypothetical protein ACRD2G_00810, partial [Terriglobia bacterium]
LRGVNDSVEALTALSEALFAAGVIPYYLHLLDRVRGAAHFEVTEAEARILIEELRARLPGYLLPRLVREIPGAPGKTPLNQATGPVMETLKGYNAVHPKEIAVKIQKPGFHR